MDDAWIWSENDAATEKFPYRVVFNSQEASRMNESNAREVMKGAALTDRAYDWSVVPSSKPGKFLVQGKRKR